jgi:hypothetical protein
MFNQFFGEEGSKRISKWMAASLMFLSAFLLVKVVGELKKLPSLGDEVYPKSTIAATGEGEVYAIPDIATFSFTVTETSESVASAQEVLNEKVAKAIDVVKSAGVEEKDIKTTSYNVYPKYEWQQIYCITVPCSPGKNKLIGYEVSQSVTVKVRDTSKLGDLVSNIGAVNVSNISGVEFTVDKKEEKVAEAREQAIKKAKEQAKILSKQLGVKLGDILYFTESGNYMPEPYYAYGKGGAEMDMVSSVAQARAEIPQGETKITSQVTITYEVK